MKDKLQKLIHDWNDVYRDLKDCLCQKGAEANTVEYAVLATEALRLSDCIKDAQELLIAEGE